MTLRQPWVNAKPRGARGVTIDGLAEQPAAVVIARRRSRLPHPTCPLPTALAKRDNARMRSLPWMLASLSSVGLAQTFVVDASNGPGTHFTDIATAVASVPEGAVLVVRRGQYAPFSIAGKSLALLGDPGVVVSAAFVTVTISGLAANQSVVMRHIDCYAWLAESRIVCSNNQGLVLIDDYAALRSSVMGGRLQASGCAQLCITNSAFSCAGASELELTNCNTSILNTSVTPTSWLNQAITQVGGTLQLADTFAAGGGSAPSAAAVSMQGGELRVAAGCSLAGSFWGSGSAALAIHGTGIVRMDPGTVITNALAAPFAPGVTLTVAPQVTVAAATGSLGGNAVASLRAASGSLAALVLGLPGPQLSVPGFADPAWLSPSSLVVQIVGTTTGPPITSGYSVPNAAWVLGARVVAQGVTLGPVAGQAISNPAVYVHW